MRSNEDIIESLPNHIVWYDSEREENCMTDVACKKAMDEAKKEASIEFFKWSINNYSVALYDISKREIEERYNLFIKSIKENAE